MKLSKDANRMKLSKIAKKILKEEYSMTHDYHGDDDIYTEKDGFHIEISDADNNHFEGNIELANGENIHFDADYKLYAERIEHDPGGYRGSQYYKASYGGYTFEFNNLDLNFYEPETDTIRTDNNKLIGLYEEAILKAADEFLNKKAKTKEYPH